MADELPERLGQLEQSVRRAAELIARLKTERSQLEAEKTALEKRVAEHARELDALRSRLGAVEAAQREVTRLREERTEILAQVESILKDLDALGLP
jgi:chromosome segregation ATPase